MIRLVVAAENEKGRSHFAYDGPPQAVRTLSERPGYRVSNLWTTVRAPAPVKDPMRVAEIKGLVPQRGGTILRVIDYPPEPRDPVEREKMFKAMWAKIFPDGAHLPANAPHPGMHATDTVDYAIVLEGEIYAVMDDGETLLRAGDVLIQCGTLHAWSNRSNRYARIAFILIDGER